MKKILSAVTGISNSLVRWKHYPWLIWALGACFFLSEYFAHVSLSVMVPELMGAFGVTALSLGTLSSFFYYPYVAMQIPVGALMDRFSAHRLLTIMALLCAISCFAFGASSGLLSAQASRALMGLSASFAFVGTLKLATMWFPAKRFGLFAGMTQALGMFGAVIGQGPASLGVTTIGWRSTMFVMGVAIVVLAIMIGLLVKDQPEDHALAQPRVASGKELLQGFWSVLQNKQSWVNAAFVGGLYAPTAAFAELWGVTYVENVYHLNQHVAATAVSFIFVGWSVGGPAMGWLSDKIQRRRPIMIISAMVSLVTLSLILYAPMGKVMLFVMMFLYGVGNTGVATSYAVSSEINPRRVAGMSMAFANMASVLIGALFQPVIGGLLDWQWDGKMAEGIRVYSAHAYQTSMLVLPIGLVICIVLGYFVKETFCKRVDD
jgi:sugar phosphate permease